jgi:hypothetical protein
MPYQYVREPLTVEQADRLANAYEIPNEQLITGRCLTPDSAAASDATSLPRTSSGSSGNWASGTCYPAKKGAGR